MDNSGSISERLADFRRAVIITYKSGKKLILHNTIYLLRAIGLITLKPKKRLTFSSLRMMRFSFMTCHKIYNDNKILGLSLLSYRGKSGYGLPLTHRDSFFIHI